MVSKVKFCFKNDLLIIFNIAVINPELPTFEPVFL